MRLDRCVGALLLLVAAVLVPAEAAAASGDALAHNVFERYFNWRLQDNPWFASQVGNHSHDDRLTSLTPAARGARLATMNSFMGQLDELKSHELSDHTTVSVNILRENIRTYIDGDSYNGYLFQSPFLNTAAKSLQELIKFMKFKTEEDYRNLLKRYGAYPRQIQEVIMLLRQGIEERMVFHNASMETVPEMLRALNVSAAESEFYAPFQKIPPEIREPVRSELRVKGERAVRTEVLDEILRLADFIEKEYLPETRVEVGVTSLPNGAAFYQACLKFHTSTDLTPEEIHQMGLDEVERIAMEMEKIAMSQGFTGNLRRFSDQLRDDPSNFVTDPDEMLLELTNIIEQRIQPQLKSIVWEVPADDVIVEKSPPNEKNAVWALYHEPAFDGSRPGRFVINTYKKAPRYEMMALTLHEANPGHHLYFSALKNNAGLPRFQRSLGDSAPMHMAPSGLPSHGAMVEGWALYAESLGDAMGLYEGRPIDRYGGYSLEMWRACRLVVDTGLHAFNWTPQQAADYMMQYTTITPDRAQDEVRRYITWPGQACSYKVGELRLKELRKRAITQLGGKFDLRTFHQVLLDCAGPLAIVESCVNRYIGDSGVWMTSAIKGTRGAAAPSAPAPTAAVSLVTALLMWCHLRFWGQT